MKQNRVTRIYLLKLKQAKKYLLKWKSDGVE
jgi:hypothetical protein